MANFTRNFTSGKMNKVVDERLVPNGEYIDALNVRMGSTEAAEIGVIENAKGNEQLTAIVYDGSPLSDEARCIGAYEDGANETIYWFIHDKGFTSSPTGKLDLVVSYNTNTTIVTFHLISINDGDGVNTTLNFDNEFTITGVSMIENLLFFTDNLNAPRRINIGKNYEDPSNNIDGFFNDDILVIKRPPVAAPLINLVQTGGQENFLSERFICFAYRYKYEDDEYSATSQFTNPAFIPNDFSYTQESFLNEGMTNFYNTAEITFNTGGPLVKGIDLLFKDANSPVIKIIEKLTKSDNGYTDFQDVTYTFKNSKIFTILPEAEILRLFDNVPRLSKGQTLMGNRLMYGNYVEGYDLIDAADNPVRLDFTVTQTNEEFEPVDGLISKTTANYDIDGPYAVSNSRVIADLSGLDLVEGAVITFAFIFKHDSWSGATPTPTVENEDEIIVDFGITLINTYTSVYEFATSEEFLALIGTSLPGGNIQPMATADNGTTMTDVYNQQFINTFIINGDGATKFASGINAEEEAIEVLADPGNNLIEFQFPAVVYYDETNDKKYYEYFKVVDSFFEFSKAGNGASLHSNRGYEIGMVYMDEYNRATTALVSQFNTAHIDCSKSGSVNSLQVNIPPSQIAPKWATRYKFAIKPDKETYDTVFTNIFFTDPTSNETYFLLEGENSQKVTEGQRFIVKTDTSGPTQTCVFTTVLEKDAKNKGFIDAVDSNGKSVEAIAGTYMKLKATNFSTEARANSIIDTGKQSNTRKRRDEYPKLNFRMVFGDGSTADPYRTYQMPGGTRVEFDFYFNRTGKRGGDKRCERRQYTLKKTLTVSQDYESFYLWYEGDNVENILNTGTKFVGDGSGSIGNVQLAENLSVCSGPTSQSLGTNYYQWVCGRDVIREDDDAGASTTEEPIIYCMSGTRACEGSSTNKKARSSAEGRIKIFRADTTLVFESIPLDASPDIWYESQNSFSIIRGDSFCEYTVGVSDLETNTIVIDYINSDGNEDQISIAPDTTAVFIAECNSASINASTPPASASYVTGLNSAIQIQDGTHLGNIQNQSLDVNTLAPAIADTGFMNCFSFGNGCESYKIRDSVLGKDFKLGNRVTSTQAVDYKEVRRFSDITYSGVYNDESNVNRLNEFNAGLLNFKALEESFGPIQLLFARETDVLTLQEDKISYVLSGKNLLSDAGTGNLLQSVPEVLGTQIARIEEFGISFNPESFSQWGPDKYFTDAKRGSVIRLVGTSFQNDQLEVVSSYGMRTWFRDLFLEDFETQKLGGFDPYMNEYVLAANKRKIAIPKTCVNCGVNQEIIISKDTPFSQCFELGADVGAVNISWSIVGQIRGDFNVQVQYDGTTYTANNQSANGTLTFQKNKITVTECDVQITTDESLLALVLSVPCPDAKRYTLVEVCTTSPSEAGLTTTNQHRFISGNYVSPLQSTPVLYGFEQYQPVVTYYNSVTGNSGEGPMPTVGSTVKLTFNKFQGQTAEFDELTNKFRFLVSQVNFPGTRSSIAQLLNLSSPLTTNTSQGPDVYSATFTMPNINDGEYLYIIYDYRKPLLVDLCFGTDAFDACCVCDEGCPEGTCNTYAIDNLNKTDDAVISYTNCDGAADSITLPALSGGDEICSTTEPVITSGNVNDVLISLIDCDCII